VGRLRQAALTGLLAALTLAAQDQPVIRVDVRLVRLLATVKNHMGELVGGLDKQDFRIYDNGVEQSVALFERHTEQPLSVALLVDTSASTAKELKYELESVKRFLRAVVREGNPLDEVKLFTFNYEVVERTGFTRRMEVVEKALANVRAEAGTSLYDAIYFGSKALEGREGRHVLVVVTDGGDTTSAYKFQQALEAAHMADAPVYSILVMPITNEAGRNIGGENALFTLGMHTGGRVFTPSVGPQLDSAFDEILRDLRTQYLLGFYPRDVPKTKNRFHKIDVKLNRPDLRVETRSGYYGEAET